MILIFCIKFNKKNIFFLINKERGRNALNLYYNAKEAKKKVNRQKKKFRRILPEDLTLYGKFGKFQKLHSHKYLVCGIKTMYSKLSRPEFNNQIHPKLLHIWRMYYKKTKFN